jgi:hypothetical protein
LWPEVRQGFKYLKWVARLLSNPEGLTGRDVRKQFRRVIGQMKAEAGRARRRGEGKLVKALGHFVKVSASYEPGLFHCCDVDDLPRTNNALEQLFGSHRYHERRASGRKGASPALVLRGSARPLARLANGRREVTAAELATADRGRWRELRAELEQRRRRRVERFRFRRDPDAYLRDLEAKLIQSGLPS